MEFGPKAPIVRGEWLEALAVRVKLHRLEWQVIAIVLSSPDPVPPRAWRSASIWTTAS